MDEFNNFIEELVTEIMSEIYFDDINETTCTLEWFEAFSPMYEIKNIPYTIINKAVCRK